MSSVNCVACWVQKQDENKRWACSPLAALAPVLMLHFIQFHSPYPPVRIPIHLWQLLVSAHQMTDNEYVLFNVASATYFQTMLPARPLLLSCILS